VFSVFFLSLAVKKKVSGWFKRKSATEK